MNADPAQPAPHASSWPPGLPRHLTLPQTNVWYNAEVSAARFPDKPFIVFYDTPITFAAVQAARPSASPATCSRRAASGAGDRVLLYMQNSPQFMLAFYGILRANAVVVPVNPMNLTEELRHYVARQRRQGCLRAPGAAAAGRGRCSAEPASSTSSWPPTATT